MVPPKIPGPETASSLKLASISENLVNEASPLRKLLLGAGEDIMNTGGTDAITPLIANLVQSMKSSLSKTMVGVSQRLGQIRQAGTPFGQRIMAETQLTGERGIAEAGPNMAMNFLSNLIPVVTGGTNAGTGGLSAAAQAAGGVAQSQNRAYADIVSSMVGAGTTAGLAAGKGIAASGLFSTGAATTAPPALAAAGILV